MAIAQAIAVAIAQAIAQAIAVAKANGSKGKRVVGWLPPTQQMARRLLQNFSILI